VTTKTCIAIFADVPILLWPPPPMVVLGDCQQEHHQQQRCRTNGFVATSLYSPDVGSTRSRFDTEM